MTIEKNETEKILKLLVGVYESHLNENELTMMEDIDQDLLEICEKTMRKHISVHEPIKNTGLLCGPFDDLDGISGNYDDQRSADTDKSSDMSSCPTPCPTPTPTPPPCPSESSSDEPSSDDDLDSTVDFITKTMEQISAVDNVHSDDGDSDISENLDDTDSMIDFIVKNMEQIGASLPGSGVGKSIRTPPSLKKKQSPTACQVSKMKSIAWKSMEKRRWKSMLEV